MRTYQDFPDTFVILKLFYCETRHMGQSQNFFSPKYADADFRLSSETGIQQRTVLPKAGENR